MECVSHVIRESLPNYLRDLPIPNSFFGFFQLGIRDWIRLVPLGLSVGGLSYLSLQSLLRCPQIGPHIQDHLKKIPGFQPPKCNHCIKKDESKVVDTIEIEDLGDKAVLCRCWKSKKFPYCDGSHNQHNIDTGDNVGPVIVKK